MTDFWAGSRAACWRGWHWVLDRGPTRPEFQQIKRLAELPRPGSSTDQEQAELKQQLDPLRQFVRREQEIRVRELWQQRKAVIGACARSRHEHSHPSKK